MLHAGGFFTSQESSANFSVRVEGSGQDRTAAEGNDVTQETAAGGFHHAVGLMRAEQDDFYYIWDNLQDPYAKYWFLHEKSCIVSFLVV